MGGMTFLRCANFSRIHIPILPRAKRYSMENAFERGQAGLAVC